MTVEATTVVSFNSSSDTEDYIFNIELDDTLNLDSEGKPGNTSFAPEDVVYLFVNKSHNVDINAVAVTAGSVHSLGGGSRAGEDIHLFATREIMSKADEIEVVAGVKDYPGLHTLNFITTSCNVSYIGNIGRVTAKTTSINGLSYYPDVARTPFMAKFNYTYGGRGYKVKPPIMVLAEDETFSLAVVFYITVNEV